MYRHSLKPIYMLVIQLNCVSVCLSVVIFAVNVYNRGDDADCDDAITCIKKMLRK